MFFETADRILSLRTSRESGSILSHLLILPYSGGSVFLANYKFSLFLRIIPIRCGKNLILQDRVRVPARFEYLSMDYAIMCFRWGEITAQGTCRNKKESVEFVRSGQVRICDRIDPDSFEVLDNLILFVVSKCFQ